MRASNAHSGNNKGLSAPSKALRQPSTRSWPRIDRVIASSAPHAPDPSALRRLVGRISVTPRKLLEVTTANSANSAPEDAIRHRESRRELRPTALQTACPQLWRRGRRVCSEFSVRAHLHIVPLAFHRISLSWSLCWCRRRLVNRFLELIESMLAMGQKWLSVQAPLQEPTGSARFQTLPHQALHCAEEAPSSILSSVAERSAHDVEHRESGWLGVGDDEARLIFVVS